MATGRDHPGAVPEPAHALHRAAGVVCGTARHTRCRRCFVGSSSRVGGGVLEEVLWGDIVHMLTMRFSCQVRVLSEALLKTGVCIYIYDTRNNNDKLLCIG